MKPQINLYNPGLQKGRPGFSARSLLISLSLLATGGFLFHSYTYLSVSHLRMQDRTTTEQLETARAKLASVTRQFPPGKKSRELEEQVGDLQRQLRDHEAAISFLKKAGMSPGEAGFSEYMQAFARRVVNGLWITAFTIDGDKLVIEGRALDEDLVPKFIDRLKLEPVMAGYRLDKLEMHLPKNVEPGKAPRYIEFSILSSKGGA
ncbi:MAG: PilN domain-containing protein [Burkholderiales bacterium]|nr:PilN domain-containing protein [Burkholderiales bacterium]